MEAEVALDAVGCEEHLAFTREDKQEAVQRLKHNSSLVTCATQREEGRSFDNRSVSVPRKERRSRLGALWKGAESTNDSSSKRARLNN